MVKFGNMLDKKVQTAHSDKFDVQPEFSVISPGRINIMGEHTDYNDGFVLPAAINYHIYASFSRNGTNKINLHAIDFNDHETIDLLNVVETKNKWPNFVAGVAHQLKDKIGGFDMTFVGNVPKGAGLSSSAALSCGAVFGINKLFSLGLEKWEMAKIAQKTEHDFIHVNCGIMDQFACLFGMTNHALKLNCLTSDYEATSFDLTGYKFVLFNSNVPHDLNETAYNARREESYAAIEFLRNKEPDVKSYQDVTLEMLAKYESEMDDVVYRRALHVVSDNERVGAISKALSEREFATVGKLLTAGHQSEKENYEITCEQTDFLVEEFNRSAQVMGSRQVGGGFGGCILGVAKDEDVALVLKDLNVQYKKKFGLALTNIPITISKGCHIAND